MITLSKHIEILLLHHDCVVVPGLGGFLANPREGEEMLDEETNVLLPPQRTVCFNAALCANDGLLVQSYMQSYDAAYPEALKQLTADVGAMRDVLEQSGLYELEGLGRLHIDMLRHITFESTHSSLLTPAFYGLGAIELRSATALQRDRDIKKALVASAALDEVASVTKSDTVEPKRGLRAFVALRWMDVAVAAAASVVLFVGFTFPEWGEPSNAEPHATHAQVVVTTTPLHRQPSAPVTAVAPAPRTSQQSAPEPAEQRAADQAVKPYTLVLASGVPETSGRAFVQSLQRAGYAETRFVVESRMNRVVYSSYATAADALTALRQLRTENEAFGQAWIMEVK